MLGIWDQGSDRKSYKVICWDLMTRNRLPISLLVTQITRCLEAYCLVTPRGIHDF